MKAIWKIINSTLVVLAALALLYCGNMYFQTQTFDPGEYTARAEALRAQAEQIRAETAREREAQQAEQDYLTSQLSRLGTDGDQLDQQITNLRNGNEERSRHLAELEQSLDDAENIQQLAMDMRHAYALSIRQLEDLINAGQTDAKICYWTFDDGPSYHTQEVLDICRETGAHVTFFTSREANQSAANDDPEVERSLLRNIIAGGHSIGNHTYSHQYAQYGNLYGMGVDSFREMVQKQDEWVTECTGIKPDIFRFPGGSAWAFAHQSKEGMVEALDDLGYRWIDWACDVADNLHSNPSAADVYTRAAYQVKGLNIVSVLSHDWNYNTVSAFARIVPAFQEMGYIFLPMFSESWIMDNTTILFS